VFVYVELCPRHAMLFWFFFFFLIAPVTFSIVYIKLDVCDPFMNIFIFSFTFTFGNQFPLRIWWSSVRHSRVHKVCTVIINNYTNMLKLISFNAHVAMPYANGFARFGLWQTQICGGIKPACNYALALLSLNISYFILFLNWTLNVLVSVFFVLCFRFLNMEIQNHKFRI
jgi:hypothetical protein